MTEELHAVAASPGRHEGLPATQSTQDETSSSEPGLPPGRRVPSGPSERAADHPRAMLKPLSVPFLFVLC